MSDQPTAEPEKPVPTKKEWTRGDKIAFWASAFASLACAITAAGVYVTWVQYRASVTQYQATERQRQVDNERSERTQFLILIQSLSGGEVKLHAATIEYGDTNVLGSIMAEMNSELLMLLLQAESLLPHMEDRKLVTEVEYSILAKHALQQGFRDRFAKYCDKANTSQNPTIRSNIEMFRGMNEYQLNNLDDALKHFEEAIDIYRKSKLVDSDKAGGEIQVYVTWIEMELDFGDKTFNTAEKYIKKGEAELERVRSGGLRESGKKYFESKKKEIADRRSNLTKVDDQKK